jgi:hypothetical protein
MDELKNRMKQDADAIRAETTPELRARIDASLYSARKTIPPSPSPITPNRSSSLWWASSITGLTAAILIVLLTNWNNPVEPEVPDISAGTQMPLDNPVSLPEGWQIGEEFLLNVESADLTRSLEEELINLQSDLEKAKENVERDVKFAF